MDAKLKKMGKVYFEDLDNTKFPNEFLVNII